MYKFPENIYPSNISYFYARSVFSFFQTQEQTKSFFKYLFYRLNEDYKKRKKGEDFCINVLRNDNNNYPLLDINYNFFILALAEWIEFYSLEKEITYEYSKYKKVTSKLEESEADATHNMRRDLKINCSIKERVLFDYSFSGWLANGNLQKSFRFELMQVLMNNILGKHTFIANYNYRNRAVVVKPTLVFDELRSKYFLLPISSFFRSTLAKYLTSKQMNLLIEMSDELKKINGKKVEKNDKNELEFEGKLVEFSSNFEIEEIEENRDQNDGKYYYLEADEKEEV